MIISEIQGNYLNLQNELRSKINIKDTFNTKNEKKLLLI